MWANPQFPVALITLTEDILNENFVFCELVTELRDNHCNIGKS